MSTQIGYKLYLQLYPVYNCYYTTDSIYVLVNHNLVYDTGYVGKPTPGKIL